MVRADVHVSDRHRAALDEAARLAAEGQPIEAIRVLTDANRLQRSADIEVRLVQLRHSAFSQVEAPRAQRPPPITAVGGADGSLPELSAAELTPGALRHGLARHGCVLVRQLVPPERAVELAAGIDHALDAFDRGAAGEPVSSTVPWYAPFEPEPGQYRVGGRRTWVRASGGVWTVDSPRMLFELLGLLEETGLTDLVTAHLGERPALSANKCTLRRVPVDSNAEWHQDGAFLGAKAPTLNVWLSLSHCGVDAPGLDILPRRLDEVVATGTEGALFDWSVSSAVVADLAASSPCVRPLFRPGDALLFDQLLLHRTAVGPGMTKERHAIETWHFAPSSYPDGQIPIVC